MATAQHFSVCPASVAVVNFFKTWLEIQSYPTLEPLCKPLKCFEYVCWRVLTFTPHEEEVTPQHRRNFTSPQPTQLDEQKERDFRRGYKPEDHN